MTVKNKATGKTYTQRITVVDQGFKIKSVSFKSLVAPTYDKKFDYKSVLTVTGSANDDIVKGITLTKSASQPIRITDNGCSIPRQKC